MDIILWTNDLKDHRTNSLLLLFKKINSTMRTSAAKEKHTNPRNLWNKSCSLSLCFHICIHPCVFIYLQPAECLVVSQSKFLRAACSRLGHCFIKQVFTEWVFEYVLRERMLGVRFILYLANKSSKTSLQCFWKLDASIMKKIIIMWRQSSN